MVAVGEAVMKAAACVHGLDHAPTGEHGAAGHVTTGQALAGREDVGSHARPVLNADPAPGTSYARHPLVGDEEDTVAVARLTHDAPSSRIFASRARAQSSEHRAPQPGRRQRYGYGAGMNGVAGSSGAKWGGRVGGAGAARGPGGEPGKEGP